MKAEKTQKTKVTMEDLESAIEICKKYLSQDNLKGQEPESKLALYAMAAEILPESVKGHVYAGLAAAYARAADEASKNNRYTEAGIYRILAVEYIQKAGIDAKQIIQAYGKQGDKNNNLGDYLRSFYGENMSKVYENKNPEKDGPKPGEQYHQKK